MTTDALIGAAPDQIAAGSASSLRDPDGRLAFIAGRPLRFVKGDFAPQLRKFLDSRAGREIQTSGLLIQTRELSASELDVLVRRNPASIPAGEWDAVFESERIPFPSYAREWPPSLLYAAAQLTLGLTRIAMREGRGLKDATPSNVLFRGPHAVFVDLLSIEQRDPQDPVWRPYAQFVRSFLIPLLLYRHTSLTPRMVFSDHREGVDVEMAAGLLPTRAKLVGPARSLVSVPVLLAGLADRFGERLYQPRQATTAQARFVLDRLIDRTERTLSALEPAVGTSQWTRYEDTTHSVDYRAAKQKMVSEILERVRPARVLDVGCNTGEYSAIAARAGAAVVAIDADVSAVDCCARRARSHALDILALVVDIAAPTPSIGWENAEEASFLDRSRGQFDVVLALALVHHLVVAARIPLRRVLDLLGGLSKELVLIELVGENDPLSRKLARGRSFDGTGLTVAEFEAACREERFTIESAQEIAGSGRVLYMLRRAAA